MDDAGREQFYDLHTMNSRAFNLGWCGATRHVRDIPLVADPGQIRVEGRTNNEPDPDLKVLCGGEGGYVRSWTQCYRPTQPGCFLA